MESQRSLLFIGLILVSFLLWQEWNEDYGPQPLPVATEQAPAQSDLSDVPVASSDVPSAVQGSDDVPVVANGVPSIVAQAANTNRLIDVVTDTLHLTIDTKGGDVIKADLLKYAVELGSEESYSLLRPDSNTLYVAQSGLVGADGPDAKARPTYQAAQTEYKLQGDTLVIPLTFNSEDGLTVTKTFTFTKGSHAINVEHKVVNNSNVAKTVVQYGRLKQSVVGKESSMFMPTYRGGAYSTQDELYDKHDFSDMADEPLKIATPAGWVGMIEHYFVSAWVPPQDETNMLTSATHSNGFQASMSFTGQAKTIAPAQTDTLTSILYLGPKDQDTLASIARGLDLTVDYGFLWFISQFLFWLLVEIQSFVGNWGVAIIVITIIVKGSMYFLTKKQYESMAKLRNLQPKMTQLKERFGDDRQKMSQAMMELYKKEKVNPMGGCLPLLLQMPIFLALYWVFLESVELRHADFGLWISDLSSKDPYFILPALTGLSMWMLQKLQPMTMTDPMQQKIMQWMPVAMSIFFFMFPAGLVLYWLVSNIITLIQAKIIYASMEKRGLKTK